MRTGLFLLVLAAPLAANDIVYLHGKVQMQDGTKPGKSASIQLSCKGSDPIRLTNAGKNGSYYIRVERDDFNHVARSLPATSMDMGGGTALSGPCVLDAKLAGYESSSVDFTNFTIGKDLKVPDLTLKKR